MEHFETFSRLRAAQAHLRAVLRKRARVVLTGRGAYANLALRGGEGE